MERDQQEICSEYRGGETQTLHLKAGGFEQGLRSIPAGQLESWLSSGGQTHLSLPRCEGHEENNILEQVLSLDPKALGSLPKTLSW